MLPTQASSSRQTPFPLALVTGAAHRLGKVFALSLARQGYAIALHYNRSRISAMAAAEEIRVLGVPVFPLQADLSDDAQVRALFDEMDGLLSQAECSLAPLRVLVNSAAVMTAGKAASLSLAEFDQAINLNLRTPFLCSQLAYQRMEQGGLIVNISDIAAQKSWTGYPAYTVSKAGLDALTRVLAHSFAPRVRVNAIAPGLVLPADDFDPEKWDRLIKRIPIQRPAAMDELGNTLEFLLKNEYITGQTLVIDGGYSLI